ncbi:hypothetical protein CYMTET_33750, partial [Cymbomonas tetramitiformis]
HGSWLFSDETMRFLEHDASARLPPAADAYELAFSLGSLSSLGLPGLQVGWVASRHQCVLERMAELRDYTRDGGCAPSEVLAVIALRARAEIIARNMAAVNMNLGATRRFFQRHNKCFVWCAL